MKATAGTLGKDIEALLQQERDGGTRLVEELPKGQAFQVFNPSKKHGVDSILAAGPGGSKSGSGISL